MGRHLRTLTAVRLAPTSRPGTRPADRGSRPRISMWGYRSRQLRRCPTLEWPGRFVRRTMPPPTLSQQTPRRGGPDCAPRLPGPPAQRPGADTRVVAEAREVQHLGQMGAHRRLRQVLPGGAGAAVSQQGCLVAARGQQNLNLAAHDLGAPFAEPPHPGGVPARGGERQPARAGRAVQVGDPDRGDLAAGRGRLTQCPRGRPAQRRGAGVPQAAGRPAQDDLVIGQRPVVAGLPRG